MVLFLFQLSVRDTGKFTEKMEALKPLFLAMNVVFLYVSTGFSSVSTMLNLSSSAYNMKARWYLKTDSSEGKLYELPFQEGQDSFKGAKARLDVIMCNNFE